MFQIHFFEIIITTTSNNLWQFVASTHCTSSPHIVQVVSILEVPNRLGSTSFQSNDVKGAQKSEFLF